jgi:hypothetical protein
MRKAKPARGEMTSQARPFWSSRHIVEPSRTDVRVYFAQNGVEFASGDVTLHLFIRFIRL